MVPYVVNKESFNYPKRRKFLKNLFESDLSQKPIKKTFFII